MTAELPKTRWRLVALPRFGGLDVEVVVDTQAPAVIEAIEEAAADHGIALVRISEEEEQ